MFCIQVYGWTPIPGVVPMHIQKIRGVRSNKTVSNSDVYITCAGTVRIFEIFLKGNCLSHVRNKEGEERVNIEITDHSSDSRTP